MTFTLIDKIAVGLTVAITLIVIALVSCGKPPTPPGPDPLTDFSVSSSGVLIEGKLKPNSPVTVAEAKRSLQIAADQIGAKNK